MSPFRDAIEISYNLYLYFTFYFLIIYLLYNKNKYVCLIFFFLGWRCLIFFEYNMTIQDDLVSQPSKSTAATSLTIAGPR